MYVCMYVIRSTWSTHLIVLVLIVSNFILFPEVHKFNNYFRMSPRLLEETQRRQCKTILKVVGKYVYIFSVICPLTSDRFCY